MRIPATIHGQQYMLEYDTNPRGHVAGVTIYSADGLTDLSLALDDAPTRYKAWDIAMQHNAASTPTVPAQPPASTGELINLGEVSRRLGLPMVTKKYLAQLGFEPDRRSHSAQLYPSGSVPSMARAISAQLQATANHPPATTATP